MTSDSLLDVANEIFYSVTKNANLMLLERAQRALMSRNIKWLLTRIENHFKSSQICFCSNLGKVFQLPEFMAKLCKSPCTISVFQKLWPFVSAHVRAFPTCKPIAKSTYPSRFYHNYTAYLLRNLGLFPTSVIFEAFTLLNSIVVSANR